MRAGSPVFGRGLRSPASQLLSSLSVSCVMRRLSLHRVGRWHHPLNPSRWRGDMSAIWDPLYKGMSVDVP